MKPISETTPEGAYKAALSDCFFFSNIGGGFNDTYRRGERTLWLDSSIVLEHRANQILMDKYLDRLFDAMVDVALVKEVQGEAQAA